jgi:hypothetical protein
MIRLKSLLNELTFATQAAFDKYNSAHTLRNSTVVTVAGKKTTAGQAEKKTEKKKKEKPASSNSNGAEYAEDDKYWKDSFKPGDKIKDGDVLDDTDFNTYRLGKIGSTLTDWFEGKPQFDYNFTPNSENGAMTVESGDDSPYKLVMYSPNDDGNFIFGFADSEGSGFTYDDGLDSGYVGGRNGMEDPQFVYQSMRYILAQSETEKFLKGEMKPSEYKPLYDKMKSQLMSDLSTKKESTMKLGSILSEITDDALMNKTIKYKDESGKDKEVLVKTALSPAYQNAKNLGMQNAYRAAKAMMDKMHSAGAKGGPGSGRKPDSQKKDPTKLSGGDFASSAEKPKSKWDDAPADSTKPWQTGSPTAQKADIPMLKDLMPNAKFDRKPLSAVSPIERQQISTVVDKLAQLGKEAKEKGEQAPNFNLCQVSIPGTNLYCDGNKGIERGDMPQFKGTPQPGSPADKLPKDENGEADTEEFFKQMLNKQGIKVSKPAAVPPDRLKATQSELVGVKVAGMSKVLENPNHPAYGKITAPIYVSNDGYVLDGHHRWAAVVAHNAANPKNQIPMNVRVIDEPIEPLVKRSNAFAEKMGIKAKKADTGAKGGPSPIA